MYCTCIEARGIGDGTVHCSVKKMHGPSVDSTMPREEACEVSVEFSCEEVVEEEASIGMN